MRSHRVVGERFEHAHALLVEALHARPVRLEHEVVDVRVVVEHRAARQPGLLGDPVEARAIGTVLGDRALRGRDQFAAALLLPFRSRHARHHAFRCGFNDRPRRLMSIERNRVSHYFESTLNKPIDQRSASMTDCAARPSSSCPRARTGRRTTASASATCCCTRGHRVVFAAEASWKGKLDRARLRGGPRRPRAAGGRRRRRGAGRRRSSGRTSSGTSRPSSASRRSSSSRPSSAPIWEELIDGREVLRAAAAGRSSTAPQPDVIIEDNVNAFPALLTAGVPFVRIVSCNPLEVHGRRPSPPVFSGYPRTTAPGWAEFRAEYDRTHRPMWAELQRRGCASQGAAAAARPRVHPRSEHLNLYVYPDERRLHRAASARRHVAAAGLVGARDRRRRASCPRRSPTATRPLDLLQPRLARLAPTSDSDAPRSSPCSADAAPTYIVSKGPLHDEFELADNMWGAEFLPQTSDPAARRPGHHPRRQQHGHRGAALRQADGACCRCSGTSTTTPSACTSRGSASGSTTYGFTPEQMQSAVDGTAG